VLNWYRKRGKSVRGRRNRNEENKQVKKKQIQGRYMDTVREERERETEDCFATRVEERKINEGPKIIDRMQNMVGLKR